MKRRRPKFRAVHVSYGYDNPCCACDECDWEYFGGRLADAARRHTESTGHTTTYGWERARGYRSEANFAEIMRERAERRGGQR